MTLRSLLFVPGDRPERFAKAAASGADALILDLEDAVAADRKGVARDNIRASLVGRRAPPAAVRPHQSTRRRFHRRRSRRAGGDPPRCDRAAEGRGARVGGGARRAARARGLGDVPLLPIATETPAAIFELSSYRAVSDRLMGLTWGAEDLPAAIGAVTSREADGRYPPYEMARSVTLFAAAAGVARIDTVYPAFCDLDGLRRYAAHAASDGFTGMMAIHPAQVAIINDAFRPSDAVIAHARRVIAASRRWTAPAPPSSTAS